MPAASNTRRAASRLMSEPTTCIMSPAPKVEGVSVVIAWAAMRTPAWSPCSRAYRSDTRTAAAPPQVGGHAINRVITPGHSTLSFSTSSAVSSVRNTALSLCLAWRLALARTSAKARRGVPYFAMWLSPAPPNCRSASGTPGASTRASAAASNCSNTLGRSSNIAPTAPGRICSNPSASTQSAAPDSIACRARNSAVEPLEQLLFTLMIGTPVMPTSYSARWPLVESP